MVPDGPLLKDIMSQQKLRAMFLVPSIIEQLLNEPNGTAYFESLDFVAYSGAPSNPAIGDRLSQVVQLVSPFGSTETMSIPELALPRHEWAWHEFNPNYKHEMELYDATEGVFELVIIADETTRDTTAIYHNLPGVTRYPTKDLFIRHSEPSKYSLYKYYGRRDDIIVLDNGEKFNPVPLELGLQTHPSVRSALVIGNGRTQPTLLVELQDSPTHENSHTDLVEQIWPLVEKANLLVPSQVSNKYLSDINSSLMPIYKTVV